MKNSPKSFIVVVLIALMAYSCGNRKSTIKPDLVMGYWKTITGDNEYARFEKVDSEYVYSAYTYDRLASSGTWELDGNNLEINFDDGTSTQLAVDFKGDTMIFNNGAEKYVRVILSDDGKTPVADINDVQILEQVIKNVNVVFSDLEPFNEDWLTPSIKWQKITTEVVLKNEGFFEMVEVANQVSKYLVTQGFDVDTTKTSEMVTGYKKGNVRVYIRSKASNEPTAGETTYVDVISGIEN